MDTTDIIKMTTDNWSLNELVGVKASFKAGKQLKNIMWKIANRKKRLNLTNAKIKKLKAQLYDMSKALRTAKKPKSKKALEKARQLNASERRKILYQINRQEQIKNELKKDLTNLIKDARGLKGPAKQAAITKGVTIGGVAVAGAGKLYKNKKDQQGEI